MCSRLLFRAAVATFAAALTLRAAPSPAASGTNLPPIDTSGFRDGAHHWRRIKDASRVIQPLPDQPAYEPGQVPSITANLLLFQRANGGWPKDYDMLAVLTPEQQAAVRASRDREDTSFDNHNTHPQVEYLARVYAATSDPACREACLRGFDFMLAAQMTNGGFPQRWPNPKGYSAHITFNDGVTIGILEVLQAAADGQPHFQWLDAARRERSRAAVQRGIACILQCQIRTDGALAGWCQQHDEHTFEPAGARTFELPSLCPQETVDIVRFLMRQKTPNSDLLRAVDAAAYWLDRSRISGIRVEKVKATPAEFLRHNTDWDALVVADPAAPPIWARHYEVGTGRPIFASRDGVKVYSLAEVDRERRTGQPWYGYWPAQLLDQDYPRWRKRLGR